MSRTDTRIKFLDTKKRVKAMNECKHLHIIGDNYGESCRDCGKQLSGYGWGGFFGRNLTGKETCIHLWSLVGDASENPVGDRLEVCIYCQRERTLKPTS